MLMAALPWAVQTPLAPLRSHATSTLKNERRRLLLGLRIAIRTETATALLGAASLRRKLFCEAQASHPTDKKPVRGDPDLD